MVSIAAEKPDVLILAHGANVAAPRVPGDGSVPIVGCDGPLPENLPAGANVIVVGTAVFNTRNTPGANISALRKAASSAMWQEI